MAYGVPEISGLTPLFPADYERYLRLVDEGLLETEFRRLTGRLSRWLNPFIRF